MILYSSDKKDHNKEPREHDYNDKDANWNGNKKKRNGTGQIRTATVTNHFFENNCIYIWYETVLTLVD